LHHGFAEFGSASLAVPRELLDELFGHHFFEIFAEFGPKGFLLRGEIDFHGKGSPWPVKRVL
jgi:hypothetical protein